MKGGLKEENKYAVSSGKGIGSYPILDWLDSNTRYTNP
jgi:hypothetical protein